MNKPIVTPEPPKWDHDETEEAVAGVLIGIGHIINKYRSEDMAPNNILNLLETTTGAMVKKIEEVKARRDIDG